MFWVASYDVFRAQRVKPVQKLFISPVLWKVVKVRFPVHGHKLVWAEGVKDQDNALCIAYCCIPSPQSTMDITNF